VNILSVGMVPMVKLLWENHEREGFVLENGRDSFELADSLARLCLWVVFCIVILFTYFLRSYCIQLI